MKALRGLFVKSHRDTSVTREGSPARSEDSPRCGFWARLKTKKKHNAIDTEVTGAKEEPVNSAYASPGIDNEISNSVLNVDNLALAANIAEKIANVVDKVPFVAPVAALLSEVLKTCKEIQDMGENRNTLDTLIGKITKDLNEMKTGLEDVQIPGSLKKDVEEYAGLLAKASALISCFDGQNKALRAINQKEWASQWTALESELDSFASRFSIKRGIEIQVGQAEIRKDLSDIQILALEKKLREWLKSPPDMAEKQHATQKLHHEGTGNWFLNGGQFSEWKKNSGSLWIEGKSGAGKSVLSSSVIAQLFNVQATAGISAVAYFYFDFRNEQNELVEIMLRSIILQLSAQSPIPYAALDQQYKSLRGQTLPTYQNLLDILEKLLLELGSTYIVLDALDECTEHDLLVRFILLLRGWSSKSPLHLLFTSQTRDLFTASFEGVEHVSLELETTQEDIAAFVTSELESNSKLKRWAKHTAEITRKVVEKSNGMFRLAACLLIELSKRTLDRNPDSILADLPGQLFEIYDRFLESIHPNNFVLVEVALRWLISSARPLSLAELEDALAFDFSDPHRHLFQPTQRDDCANRVCSLLEGLVTVGRLNYWNETPVVVLAHASVADYLKSPQFAARHKCDLSQGFSHTFLAQTCVGYLLHFADHPLNAETFPNYPLSSYAAKYWSYHLLRCHDRATLETSTMRLLEAGSGQYATLNHLHCPEWHSYWESMQSPSWRRDGPPPLHLCSGIGLPTCLVTVSVLMNDDHPDDVPMVVLAHASVADYLKSPQFAKRHKCDLNQGCSHTFLAHSCVGYLLHFADHPLNMETFPDYPLSSYAAEHWSYHLLRCDDRATLERSTMHLLEAGSGQYAAFNHLHSQRWYDYSPDWQRDGPPPLRLCSEMGYTEGVHLLLKKDAHEDDIVVALRTASGLGHINIVRLLLEKGANFNAADGKHGSALQAASAGGHTEIVRLLLENGADVNAEGGVYGSALQGASEQGSLEIFRILLEEGADVNMAGGFYGSALQAASRQGSLEIVRILLKEGADVNAAGGRYGSALQAASYYGSLEIVRLLLESGADLNATGGIYGSALQAACEGGVREIVRLLLENGAHVNAEGGHCGTALRVASIFGQTEIVRLLLENGADVNASGGQDGSPLQDASEEGYTAIVQLLREHGAVDENSEEEDDEEDEDKDKEDEDEEEATEDLTLIVDALAAKEEAGWRSLKKADAHLQPSIAVTGTDNTTTQRLAKQFYILSSDVLYSFKQVICTNTVSRIYYPRLVDEQNFSNALFHHGPMLNTSRHHEYVSFVQHDLVDVHASKLDDNRARKDSKHFVCLECPSEQYREHYYCTCAYIVVCVEHKSALQLGDFHFVFPVDGSKESLRPCLCEGSEDAWD
ncbi:hypothetical protein C8R44DRAFT_985058 [Mycena epipterygia]|nr:hypothetical protein C8R44DRAFT_985058 [Mycena epipterygia]